MVKGSSPLGSTTLFFLFAGVAKLADALDLGSNGAIHGGSSPFTRTSDESVRTIRTLYIENLQKVLFYVIMYLARELA